MIAVIVHGTEQCLTNFTMRVQQYYFACGDNSMEKKLFYHSTDNTNILSMIMTWIH